MEIVVIIGFAAIIFLLIWGIYSFTKGIISYLTSK